MSAKKPRNPISSQSDEWGRTFVKHLQLNLINSSQSLPPDASTPDFRVAAIRAMILTLYDSGMTHESVMAAIGQVLIEQGAAGNSVQWTDEMNHRRFELIDNGIQGTLTSTEEIELAGLTKIMRDQLDSDANLPLEGVKALHRRLRSLIDKDQPH